MILKKYDELPSFLQTEEVSAYYEKLQSRKASLVFKRIFDFTVALIAVIILSPLYLVLALAIRIDSEGPVFYRQERVTTYGRKFRIFKFRTMVVNADKIGTLVTVKRDPRITRVGAFLRKFRLDETPQLINILTGDMSFVGTRPEVQRYVDRYTDEMNATLLLPAGVTSLASIFYKDEDKLLANAENADDTYIEEVLPGKMEYNLAYIEKFSFFYDIKLMIMTVLAVVGVEFETDSEKKDAKEREYV